MGSLSTSKILERGPTKEAELFEELCRLYQQTLLSIEEERLDLFSKEIDASILLFAWLIQ